VPAWSDLLYTDSNCNALLDSGEPALGAGPVPVTAGQQVCLLVKEFVPASAGMGSNNQATVTATFNATGATPVLAAVILTRRDITTVSISSDLQLYKSVSATTAVPGATLIYTLQYTNAGTGPLSTVKINDWTPSFTLFQAASCGPLPLNLTACNISSPAVNATGAIVYTMTGTLAPGSSGTVNFTVKVEP
jgi:uncharacterized repeat protein (TIGR01451 family)